MPTAAKVPNLHYVIGEDLIGRSGVVDLPTAMGTHPTDLGHHLIASYYAKALPPILAGTALPLRPEPSWVEAANAIETGASRAPVSMPLPIGVDATNQQGLDQGNQEWSDDEIEQKTIGAAQHKHSTSCQQGAIAWSTARTELHIGGRVAWKGHPRENFFDRFPLDAQANVTSGGGGHGIWGLSKCTPGEFVGFSIKGNVSALWVNYSVYDKYGTNPSGGKLPIMPAVGRNGVDLYAQTAATGAWVWAGNIGGVTPRTEPTTEICGPLTALTDDDAGARTNPFPLDVSAATRCATRHSIFCQDVELIPVW